MDTKILLTVADDADITHFVNSVKIHIEKDGSATVFLEWPQGINMPEELKAAVWVRQTA